MDSELEKLKAEIARLKAELESRDAGADEERRAMLFMLAESNSASEAMEKAQGALREEMEVTTQLLMISEALVNITDIDRFMKEVIHCVQKVLGSDICLIYAWDAEAKSFVPVQELGLPREAVPQFRTESLDADIALIKTLLGGKEAVITARSVEDIMRGSISDDGVRTEEIALSWLPFGDTIAGISLTSKKKPLGLILAVFRQEKDFTDREFQVMQGMSNQVSVSLEQARLYREAIDRTLELSHKIETIKVMSQIDSSILSTLKADELLETVTRLISKVIPCERATVSLVDMERGGFIYKAGFGTAAVPKSDVVPFADTSTSGIVETGRTECVNNLSELTPLLPLEKRFLDEGFLSHIRVPITIKGDVAGILTVGAKRVAAFTKENLSTLEYLCSQIGVALSNAHLISDLEELFIGVVKSLSSAIDAKSPWTAGHSERVTRYALDIAKHMGLPEKELKNLELSGLLHDIGKIGTYESILDKPSKLTDEELTIMRLHPVKGAEILQPIKQLKDIILAVRQHHEFYDGTGYPDGLKGDAISLHARILTVADTVDAMGADRPYRKGMAMDLIIAELKRCSGTQFDPMVVEAFLKVSGMAEELKMAAS